MSETQDKERRGEAAAALLSNEIFKDTISRLDRHYVDAWRQARTVEAREDAHRYVTLVVRLIADLRSVANTGEIERKRRAELEGRAPQRWSSIV